MREGEASVAVCWTQGKKQRQEQETMSWKCGEMQNITQAVSRLAIMFICIRATFPQALCEVGRKGFLHITLCILLLLQKNCLMIKHILTP